MELIWQDKVSEFLLVPQNWITVTIFTDVLINYFLISDLFQPKTSTFSTCALIWVHFKNVRYFSQLIFSSVSYLKHAQHNLVIELCRASFFFKNIVQLFINFTHSFAAIELLTFCKNAKKLYYCSGELSLFWLNK